MKNKKIYLIIALIIVLICTILFIVFRKNDKEKSISLEMVLPSKAVVTYDPVFGDIVTLKIDDTATFEINAKNIDKNQIEYVILNSDIAKIENNVLTGIKSGTTTIYATSKKDKITSNEIKIKVGED